jgi:outer membrane protein insertion porin family
VKIHDISATAPAIVWDADGKETIRALELDFGLRDLDRILQPSSGYRVRAFAHVASDLLASQTEFWRAGVTTNVYLPIYRDSRNRAHVVELRNSVRVGAGMGDDDNLYLTERYFMGGQGSVRGFDFRGAGPTQFGHPTGGEALYLGSVEYSFPLFSSRLQGALEETELLRGVLFVDGGMLGNDLGDEFFRQLRLTSGFGIRVRIPGLGGLPIALDFAWPILRETTDDLEVFSFTFRFN